MGSLGGMTRSPPWTIDEIRERIRLCREELTSLRRLLRLTLAAANADVARAKRERLPLLDVAAHEPQPFIERQQ